MTGETLNPTDKNVIAGKKIMFVDAEVDGLYGDFLSVGAIVCDESGNELNVFDHYRNIEESEISDPWVRQFVFPYMKTGCPEENENALLHSFWDFYCKYKDNSMIIADVPYPVECRLFEKCVRMDFEKRFFEGPYPLMDLSSMLYAVGKAPLTDRTELIDNPERFRRHSAIDDVRISKEIWKKWVMRPY
ncbi:MAG: hypothetical protein IKP88_00125 [Lachnospiraceae bacterium]|nr:hypothetical protein [Lachnospiraceae bacterium]